MSLKGKFPTVRFIHGNRGYSGVVEAQGDAQALDSGAWLCLVEFCKSLLRTTNTYPRQWSLDLSCDDQVLGPLRLGEFFTYPESI